MLAVVGEASHNLALQSLKRWHCDALGTATDIDMDVAQAGGTVSCKHFFEVEGLKVWFEWLEHSG